MTFQNYINLEGRLTRDPEHSVSKHGSNYTTWGICYNQYKKVCDEFGNIKKWESVPHFFNCVAFGNCADEVALMKKGDLVSLIGKLEFSQWERDGKRVSSVNIIAEAVKKLVYTKKEKKESVETSSAFNGPSSFKMKKATQLKAKSLTNDAIVF